MPQHIKIFFTFAIVLLLLIFTKFYKEYQDTEILKMQIIENESKSLSAVIMAFRQTYQEAFVKNKIPINDKTIHLLPVRTIHQLSHKFSKMLNGRAIIKTVSNRPRNPISQANKKELEIINFFKNNKNKKVYLERSNNGEINYFAQPMYIQQGCLKCHGKRENAPITIRNNYSKAYDYHLGDLRGILTVEMQKSKIIKSLENNFRRSIMVACVIYILFLLSIFLMIRIIRKNQAKYANDLEIKLKKQEENLKKQELTIIQQSKMAAMGEMIGNIAHQWRQPLSMISTIASTNLVQKELGILDDKTFTDNSHKIMDAVNHLSQTIDDFRNFFKESKEKNNFNIKKVLEKNITLIGSSLKDNNIILEQDIDTNINLYGLENELTQAILNILNNAKDVLRDNNNLEEKVVFVITKIQIINNKDFITIIIKDNAGGVPEKIINKIFEPYFTTKHQSQGTGIGLYMTRQIIVDNMHGKLEVQNVTFQYNNNKYIGAQFTITLPLS